MRKNMLKTTNIILLFLLAVITVIPFLWMVSTSIKNNGSIYQMPPEFLVVNPEFSNYKDVFEMVPMRNYFINSIMVSIAVTLGTLITTILASYAFSKLRFKGRDVLFTLVVATMMIPGEVLVAPNFITISKMGLLNTRVSLFLPWIASGFSIFLLRQYFLQVPEELHKASKIDGATEFQYITRILVPYSKPALITIALLRIINSWNEFLWPLIMINDPIKRTLPVGLTTFVSEAGTQYNLLMAYATIVVIPIIFLYIIAHKYIIQGFTKGGIKG